MRSKKELLGQLWEGKVDAAIELLNGALEWVRNPAAVNELIGYLEKRREYIPDYQERQRAGLWIASTRVEKFNDWAVSGRCKHQGMSWSPAGVLALAALEAARRNGELDGWRQDRCAAGASIAKTSLARPLDCRTDAPTSDARKKLANGIGRPDRASTCAQLASA